MAQFVKLSSRWVNLDRVGAAEDDDRVGAAEDDGSTVSLHADLDSTSNSTDSE